MIRTAAALADRGRCVSVTSGEGEPSVSLDHVLALPFAKTSGTNPCPRVASDRIVKEMGRNVSKDMGSWSSGVGFHRPLPPDSQSPSASVSSF